MAGEYKFHVRDDKNAQWVNILKDTQIEVVDDNNSFPVGVNYVSEALDWIVGQIGGPGYGGQPIHVTDTTLAIDVVDEGASLTIRGGAEIFKNVIVGGNSTWGSPSYDQVALEVLSTLDATDATTGSVRISGGVGIQGKLFVGTDITSTTATTTGLATFESIVIGTTGVASALTPDAHNTYDLGEDLVRWNTLYVDTLDTNNLTTSGDLTGSNLNTTGTTTTENLIVNGVISVDVDTLITGNLVPATGVQTLGSLSSPWNTLYVDSLDIGNAINGTFIGTFTGNLSGNVTGTTVTANTITASDSFQGDVEGNIIGDTSEVTSAWDVVDDGDTGDAFEVRGGMKVDKNLTIDRSVYVGQNLTITGNILAGNLDFANFNSNITPVTTDTYNLGSVTKRFNEIHATSIAVDSFSTTNVTTDLIGNVLSQDGLVVVLENGTNGSNATFTGNVTGNLTGNLSSATTTFNNLSGAGITASGTIQTAGLNVSSSVSSNLIPDADDTRNLGALTKRWSQIHGDEIRGSSFIGGSFAGSFLGDLAGDLVGTNTTVTGNLQVDGNLSIDGTLTASNLSFTNVMSNLIGDVYAGNAINKVLENGTDGTDASFTGSVTGNVTGNLAGNLTAPVVNVTGNTPSTNWNNGTLVVTGGVGISDKLYVQGNITTSGGFTIGGTFQAPNASFQQLEASGITNSVSKDTGAFIVTQGGMGVELDVNVGGYLSTIGLIRAQGGFLGDTISSNSTDTNLTVTANGTGIVEIADGLFVSDQTGNTVDIDVATDISGTLIVSNTTGSTDKDTGALIVDGGVGVEENLFVGGNINATGSGTFNTTLDVTGLSILTGGVDIDGAVDIDITGGDFDVLTDSNINLNGNNVNIDVTTLFTLDSGSITIASGNDLNVNSIETLDLTVTAGGVSLNNTSDEFTVGLTNFTVNSTTSNFGGSLTTAGAVVINDITPSIDKDTGALVVNGGVGVEGDLNIGGDFDANAITANTFTGAFIGNLNGDVTGSIVGGTISGTTVTASLGLVGDLTKATTVQVTNSTPAHVYGTGALVVANGTAGPTLGSGATFEGNVWIGGNLTLPTAGTDITLPSGRTVEDELDARPVENGFVDRAESTISFNDGLMRFTITPTTTEFTFYSGGVGFTKTAAETVDITNTEGLWYIYYVGDVLTASQTFSPEIISTHAFVAALYWSVQDSQALTFAEERHGNVMSNATHSYLHNTQGSKLAGGGALGNLSTDDVTPTDTSVQLDVANFVTYDEDIRRDITDGSPQTLVGPALLPVWYREWNGTIGQNVWRKQAAGTIPLVKTGTGGEDRPAWNQNVGGQYQLTEATDLNFMAMHIVATNDVNEPVVAIVGQAQYADLNSAYEGGGDEAGNIEFGQIDSLSPEWVFLGTVILEVDETYTNTYKARFRADVEGNDYIDLRGSALSPSGGTTADDHAGLTNLQGGTISAYYHSDQMINVASTPRWAGINIDYSTAINASTLTVGRRYMVPTAVSMLLLPAAPTQAGQSIHLSDTDNSWGSSPVTLNSNGNPIEGAVQNMILNVPGASLELIWSGTTWKII